VTATTDRCGAAVVVAATTTPMGRTRHATFLSKLQARPENGRSFFQLLSALE